MTPDIATARRVSEVFLRQCCSPCEATLLRNREAFEGMILAALEQRQPAVTVEAFRELADVVGEDIADISDIREAIYPPEPDHEERTLKTLGIAVVGGVLGCAAVHGILWLLGVR